MVNKSGRIGTAAESGVCKYLVANGYPLAERRRLKGSLDAGDLVTVPGLVIEVKAGEQAKSASLGQVEKWLQETEIERVNAKADAGILVVQRRGVAPARAGLWRAIMPSWTWQELITGAGCTSDGGTVEVTLAYAVQRLRMAGYGEPWEWDAIA